MTAEQRAVRGTAVGPAPSNFSVGFVGHSPIHSFVGAVVAARASQPRETGRRGRGRGGTDRDGWRKNESATTKGKAAGWLDSAALSLCRLPCPPSAVCVQLIVARFCVLFILFALPHTIAGRAQLQARHSHRRAEQNSAAQQQTAASSHSPPMSDDEVNYSDDEQGQHASNLLARATATNLRLDALVDPAVLTLPLPLPLSVGCCCCRCGPGAAR